MEKNTWVKSSSCPNNATCVEILDTGTWIYVKSGTSSTLRFTHAEWEMFLTGVRNGEFDTEEG
jgi:hypothetical protein